MNNNNPTFHHVAINVVDYNRTVKFYEGLGFKKKLEWEENGYMVCFLNTNNGMMLELHGGRGDFENSRLAHISIYVNDVDSFYRLALRSGGESIQEPFDADALVLVTGKKIFSRICWIRSPNGEKIEVLNWKGYDSDDYKNFEGE